MTDGRTSSSTAARQMHDGVGLKTTTRAVLMMVRRLQIGSIAIQFPDGRWMKFDGPQPGPYAEVHLKTEAVTRKLIFGGDIAFAESYMAGEWDTPNLSSVIEVAARNFDEISQALTGNLIGRIFRRVRHFLNGNSRQGSKRNIAHHYDIGNSFYEKWLDSTMTYSAAVWEPSASEADLEAAQLAKYRRIARIMDLKPGQSVLEIGCGWGGFAEVAAKEFGAHVTGLTLSREQHDFAAQRMQKAGISEQVDIRFQDYRDVSGTFDRIASIEMFEAVGERYWPVFFDKLRTILAPGGLAGMQIITIHDRGFESYRRRQDFIQKYIFPGGMLPSPSRLSGEIERAGLRLVDDVGFGQDYARTLAEWRDRFLDAWPEIAPLGFDERFRRMWQFYLAYCEGGFRAGNIDVRQIAITRS